MNRTQAALWLLLLAALIWPGLAGALTTAVLATVAAITTAAAANLPATMIVCGALWAAQRIRQHQAAHTR